MVVILTFDFISKCIILSIQFLLTLEPHAYSSRHMLKSILRLSEAIVRDVLLYGSRDVL